MTLRLTEKEIVPEKNGEADSRRFSINSSEKEQERKDILPPSLLFFIFVLLSAENAK